MSAAIVRWHCRIRKKVEASFLTALCKPVDISDDPFTSSFAGKVWSNVAWKEEDTMTQNNRRLTALAVAGGSLIALRQWARHSRRIDFTGKNVVISGGSRGLGLELARQFAYRGANLVLLARDEGNLLRSASELESLGAQVRPIICDITRSTDVQQAVQSIMRQTGRIDVLINNAGIIQVGPMENMTAEDYQQSMRVHFCGPLSLIQQVVPVMQAARFGRIVNIASIGGKVAVPHLLPYVAASSPLSVYPRGYGPSC